MVDTYCDGKKTVCYECKKRHPRCHNCKERQEEIDREQAAKEANKDEFPFTHNFMKQQRRRPKEMRRY